MADFEIVNPRRFYRPFWLVSLLWTGTIATAGWYLYHQTTDALRQPPQLVHLHIEEGLTQAVLVILLTFLSFKVFTLAGGKAQLRKRRTPTVEEAAKVIQVITAGSMSERRRSGLDTLLAIQSFFLTHRTVYIGIYILLPAGIFFLAMLVKYEAVDQPAVFVMALAGIYVAAEHYNGLVQHEKQVDALKSHVETLNNALGIVQGRRELYRAYSEPGVDIAAVVRLFDIDPVWWSCKENSSEGPWHEYENRSDLTFYSALFRGRCPTVMFVSDMPPPAIGPESDLKRADRFGRLIGLIWQCVIFFHLRRALASPIASLRIKIAFTYKWVHVVDDSVYQLVDLPDGATLRNLTLEIRDEEKKQKLVNAERAEILACAARGCDAEEYISSLLRYAGRKENIGSHRELVNHQIESIMKALGYLQWLDHRSILFPESGEKSVDLIHPLCVAIFREFISTIQDRNVRREEPGLPTEEPKSAGTLLAMALELL